MFKYEEIILKNIFISMIILGCIIHMNYANNIQKRNTQKQNGFCLDLSFLSVSLFKKGDSYS